MRASGEPQALPDALGIIPARYGSTRLPAKPLVPLLGKPLVQHVWERARRARRLAGLVVATDDDRIARAVAGFGGEVVMTSPEHRSGTDRLAEVARGRSAALYVNIQGDEPLLEPGDIDTLVDGLARDAEAPMGTLAVPLADPREAEDANVVKVVCDTSGRALYFSRARIPHPRHQAPDGSGAAWRRHIGIYAYRREFLLEFASWPPTPLETMEGLEQLRALERGGAIRVFPARGRYLGVDTPEDVAAVQNALREGA
jgi:3-deoxy-manno-octulosonate cytidylyltransferase (CMP-KDO synthetase)